MNKIDKMIAELCPNGVEYKKLGEVATINRGGNFQKKTFVKTECLVFTMDRYIPDTDCL